MTTRSFCLGVIVITFIPLNLLSFPIRLLTITLEMANNHGFRHFSPFCIISHHFASFHIISHHFTSFCTNIKSFWNPIILESNHFRIQSFWNPIILESNHLGIQSFLNQINLESNHFGIMLNHYFQRSWKNSKLFGISCKSFPKNLESKYLLKNNQSDSSK